jgi:transposase-like protein
MTSPVTEREAPRCPFCSEDVLIEFDAVIRRYVCSVCTKTWTPEHTRSTAGDE